MSLFKRVYIVNMLNLQDYLNGCLRDSYGYSELCESVEPKSSFWKVPRSSESDYAFGASIAVSKMLKGKGVNVSTEGVIKELEQNLHSSIKDKFDVSHDDKLLQFNLKDSYISSELKKLFNSQKPKVFSKSMKSKILVDFSSPNVAKNLHVGHLRSTIIGDTISRLFEYLGHDVLRVNHVGDFGTQFGMLIQHLFDVAPDFQTNPPDITNLQKFYQESKKRFDKEPEFKDNAYQKTVLLQKDDPDVVAGWKLICDISRKSYNKLYEQLNVTLTECGESFYKDMLADTVKELEELGLVEESNGMKIIQLTKMKKGKEVPKYSVPLFLVKSDGGYTYDTTDLAALRYRLKTLNVDQVYYVVDCGQATHFNMVFEVAQKAGCFKEHQKAMHIGFGLVLGEDGKRMKSRDGDTIPLQELLDEGLEAAKKSLSDRDTDHLTEEEMKEIVPTVAYGAIKYADLSGKYTNNYTFSFDRMLSFKGNTVVYQLYSHVRLNGILRKIEEYGFKIEYPEILEVKEDDERAIAIKLLQYPEMINEIESDLFTHRLCTYLYELSDLTQKFYTHHRCIEFDADNNPVSMNSSRAVLCQLVLYVQKVCFDLLNIQTLEKI